MDDKFTRYYVILTIVYGILCLLEFVGYYADNIILTIIIFLLSFLDIAWLIVSIIYLVHVIKQKLDSKYRVLPISYILLFVVLIVINVGILFLGISKGEDITHFLETTLSPDSVVNQILMILTGCYSIFQIVYGYYLLKR